MKSFLVRCFSKAPQAIVLSVLIIAALFAGAAAILPPHTNVSVAFTIAQQARQETSDYSYDGYYALRASELVADTMLSWLATPSIVKEIYASAEIPMADAEINALAGRIFRAKKFSSQNVVVSYAAPDMETARKLYDGLALVLPTRTRELVLTPDQNSLFIVTISEPVIAEGGISPVRAALAGAFVGGFIGLACAYAAQKKNPQA